MCVNACCAGNVPSSYGGGRDSIVSTYRNVIDCNVKLRSSHAIEVTLLQSVDHMRPFTHSVVGGARSQEVQSKTWSLQQMCIRIAAWKVCRAEFVPSGCNIRYGASTEKLERDRSNAHAMPRGGVVNT